MKLYYGNLLSSPIAIGNRQAPNRIVHEPMECNDFLGGLPSGLTISRYKRLAAARAGITVVECGGVLSSSKSRLHGFMADEWHKDGINTLTREFKKINQDTLLCYQLSHFAQRSDPRFSEVVRLYDVQNSGASTGRILTTSEIKEIRNAFIKSAEIVHTSGADMVDIKLCHGHFGHQIIRPANNRNDEYGGNLENRMRFAREVITSIRDRIKDPNFKIMVRFQVYEDSQVPGKPAKGGVGTKGSESIEYSFDEPAEMLKMLAGYGVEVFNITGGGFIMFKVPGDFIIDDPQSYPAFETLYLAKKVKDLKLNVPVIASGFSVLGNDIPKVGSNAVKTGYADMVGIGRQILADPDAERIIAGKANYCVRCKGCMDLVEAQMPGGCTHYDSFYALLEDLVRFQKNAVPK